MKKKRDQKKREDFCEIVVLLDTSPAHRRYSVEDIYRIIYAPIVLDQYRIYRDAAGRALTFVTWAWLSPMAARGFIDRTRLLQPGDFQSGDELWFIDIVGHNPNMRGIVRDLQSTFGGAKGGYHMRMRERGVVRGMCGKRVDYVGC